jgi:hypothetical protein
MKKNIIYVMSDVRSGSTLLENILSSAPNMLSVGELHHLDSHLYKGKWGRTWNWTCSCGKSIKNCNFWNKVIRKLGNRNIKITQTSINLINKDNSIVKANNLEVINKIDDIYDAIFEENNANIIVDSSKNIAHGKLLYDNSKYNILIIYLKRDIRAVTISKNKWEKKFNHKEKGIFHILLRTKIYDIKLKKALKSIDPKHLIEINYEELAKKPQQTIRKIVQKFDFPSFDVSEYMDTSSSHTIGGTPSRFEKSPIKYDDKWEKISKRKPVFHVVGKLMDLL